MEFSIKRRKKGSQPFLLFQKKIHNEECNTSTKNNNFDFAEGLTQSLSNSFMKDDKDMQSTIYDENVRSKASKLLKSAIATPRLTFRNPINRQSHLSLLYSPKKRTTQSDIPEALCPQKKTRHKILKSNFSKHRAGSKDLLLIKSFQNEPFPDSTSPLQPPQIQHRHFSVNNKMTKKHPLNHYKLTDYFQLVFSKFLSKNTKQKCYILIQDLAKRYQQLPQIIAQDVKDIRSIAKKLQCALGCKDNYVQLKPFQALEVNGEFARLVFHLVHQVMARKFGNYDLVKIYKEIQYCSRRLQFHNFTLKVCFQLGELYKENNDEFNSHAYYVKALKLAIFLNDKFHQEKAIDCFGLTAYRSSKSGQAIYYHENFHKLCHHQRQTILSKYSNNDEMQKISTQKRGEVLNQRSQNFQKSNERRKQTFKFQGKQQLIEDYQVDNKRKFKQNISRYIQCPEMRAKILVAKNHMRKIQKIGKIDRFINFQTSRLPLKFNEDIQLSSEIFLTHRSSNRRNPEYENRAIEKQRKCLLQIIGYYTNQIINPFHL